MAAPFHSCSWMETEEMGSTYNGGLKKKKKAESVCPVGVLTWAADLSCYPSLPSLKMLCGLLRTVPAWGLGDQDTLHFPEHRLHILLSDRTRRKCGLSSAATACTHSTHAHALTHSLLGSFCPVFNKFTFMGSSTCPTALLSQRWWLW